MLKQLARDTLLYSISGFLSKAISFILIPIYTKVLPTDVYGMVDLMQAYCTVGIIIVSAEIIQSFARYYIGSSSRKSKEMIASTVLLFLAISYAFFLVVSFIFSPFIKSFLFGTNGNEKIVVIGVLSSIFVGIFGFHQFLLRYSFNPLGYLVASLVYTVVSSVASVLLITKFQLGADGFFYGQIIGAMIAILSTVYLVRRLVSFKVSLSCLKRLLAYSIPLIPSSLGIVVASYIDRIMIKRYMTMEDVSVYGIAARYSTIINLLVLGFASALNPIIIRDYKKTSTRATIGKIFVLFCGASSSAVLFFLFFSTDIVRLMTAVVYYPAAAIIPILVTSVLFMNMYVFFPGLSYTGKTKKIAVISILGAALNTILNVLLIPKFGISGAALANMTNSIATFILYAIFSWRAYSIHIPIRGLVFAIFPFVLVGLVQFFAGRVGILGGVWIKLALWTILSITQLFIILREIELERPLKDYIRKISKR